MKEFTNYWCSGQNDEGVCQSEFFAEPESQFIVTNIIAKSDSDNLVIRRSYQNILGLPSIVTTKEILDGDQIIEVSSLTGSMGETLQAGLDITVQGSIPYFAFTGNIQSIQLTNGHWTVALNGTYHGSTIEVGATVFPYDNVMNIPMMLDGQSGYVLNIQGDGLACSIPKNGMLIQLYGTNPELFVSGYYDDIS